MRNLVVTIGCAAARAQAHCKLVRAGYCASGDASSASRRRADAQQRWTTWKTWYATRDGFAAEKGFGRQRRS